MLCERLIEWLNDLECHCEMLCERLLLCDILADLDWLGRFVCERLLLCEALRHWLIDREIEALRLRLWLSDCVWDLLALVESETLCETLLDRHWLCDLKSLGMSVSPC